MAWASERTRGACGAFSEGNLEAEALQLGWAAFRTCPEPTGTGGLPSLRGREAQTGLMISVGGGGSWSPFVRSMLFATLADALAMDEETHLK
jgi:hypothetical protein